MWLGGQGVSGQYAGKRDPILLSIVQDVDDETSQKSFKDFSQSFTLQNRDREPESSIFEDT